MGTERPGAMGGPRWSVGTPGLALWALQPHVQQRRTQGALGTSQLARKMAPGWQGTFEDLALSAINSPPPGTKQNVQGAKQEHPWDPPASLLRSREPAYDVAAKRWEVPRGRMCSQVPAVDAGLCPCRGSVREDNQSSGQGAGWGLPTVVLLAPRGFPR